MNPEQRRLLQVARVCEGYGNRVQDSVFECRLSAAALQRLIVELCDVIDFGLDSVNVYKFDGPLARARTSLGRKVGNDLGEPWFV
jgi:CRISPR-associated protein Cas2